MVDKTLVYEKMMSNDQVRRILLSFPEEEQKDRIERLQTYFDVKVSQNISSFKELKKHLPNILRILGIKLGRFKYLAVIGMLMCAWRTLPKQKIKRRIIKRRNV